MIGWINKKKPEITHCPSCEKKLNEVIALKSLQMYYLICKECRVYVSTSPSFFIWKSLPPINNKIYVIYWYYDKNFDFKETYSPGFKFERKTFIPYNINLNLIKKLLILQ